MRFIYNLLALLVLGLVFPLRRHVWHDTPAVGPPDPSRKRRTPSPVSRRHERRFIPQLQILPDLVMPAVWTVPGLDAVTAIEVLDDGSIQGVGWDVNAAQVRVGETFLLSPTGAYSHEQLAGLPNGFGDVMPMDLRNGRAVGFQLGFSEATGKTTELSIGWALDDPEKAYNLGSVLYLDSDIGRPSALNVSGVWVGDGGGGRRAVYGQLFENTPSAIDTGVIGAQGADDIADDGTKLLTVATASGNQAWVQRPDGTFIVLHNPFASEGSTDMFGWRISQDGTKILCNVFRFNPDRETVEFTPVLFSGPNFSQATPIPGNVAGSFWGKGADVENSGLVTIEAADGIYLWRPGDIAPQKLQNLTPAGDVLPGGTYTVPLQAGNPVEEKGGFTYVAFQSGGQSYIVRLDSPSQPPPPPPADPPATITGSNGRDVIVIDLSQYKNTQLIVVDTRGGADVVRVIGTATNNPTIRISTGAGADQVFITANGNFNAFVDLGAGSDLFDGHLSTGRFDVTGGAGSDFITGSNVTPGTYQGGAGSDTIIALSGGSEIETGAGLDIVITGGGKNKIRTDGLDVVFANLDDEVIGRSLLLFRGRRWL